MQKTFLLLTAALVIHFGDAKANAAPNISVDFFYDQLGDYGDWVEVGDYGYAWQPRDVDQDWRPYSDGRWAYTEAGWTWLSEEPYGWAVYHYGRWAQIERKGWVWIPGTEWAPAWVSWRRSPQHVGWAPLPPEASFRRSVGISVWADSYYDIGPSAYRFVEVRNFGAPRLRTVFVEPRENITIIRQTTNITRITYVNNVIYNGGPRYEDISRESAEPVRRLRLERRVEIEGDRKSFRGEQMRSRVDGDSLRVFAPGFDARTAAPPQKLSAKIEKVEVNRGWKDAGPAADVEKLRAKVRSEATAPKGLPPQPKFEKLAEQTAAPEIKPTNEKPVAVAPGKTSGGAKMKDGGKGNELPITPVVPPVEPKVTPLEKPVAPKAPTTPQKPGKGGKPEKTTDTEVPGKRPGAPAGTEGKPEKVVPPGAEPANPGGKGKNPKPSELVRPTPVDPVDPKPKPDRPDARRELPATPVPPSSTKKRPEAAREVPPAIEKTKPKAERPNVPNVTPGNVPQPAPRGEAEKPKPGKGKGKGEKKPEDEAPKVK